jgi:hypothetical protein
VPELVRHVAHDFGVRAVCYLAVQGHIGDIGQLRVLEPAGPALDLGQPQIQWPQGPGERNLLVFRQRLVAPHQHGVLVHGGFNRAHLVLIKG